MSNRLCLIATFCAAWAIVFATQVFAQSQLHYRMTKVVPLGLPDHWDFVVFNENSHKVLVAPKNRVLSSMAARERLLAMLRGCLAVRFTGLQLCLKLGADTRTMEVRERLHPLMSTSCK